MEGKESNAVKHRGDIPRELVEKLAKHWNARKFEMLSPPDPDKITAEGYLGMLFWKSIIEDAINEILESLKIGGNHG